MVITEEQKNAIEQFSEALLAENYPPLSGRILGLFYVSDKKYFTFNELVEILEVTKGSVSKALSFLQDHLGIIKFIFKDGIKRRRYFYVDIPSNIEYLERFIASYKTQNEIYKVALRMRGEENIEMNKFLENNIMFNEAVLKSIEEHFDKSFQKTNDHINN